MIGVVFVVAVVAVGLGVVGKVIEIFQVVVVPSRKCPRVGRKTRHDYTSNINILRITVILMNDYETNDTLIMVMILQKESIKDTCFMCEGICIHAPARCISEQILYIKTHTAGVITHT